MAEDQGTTELSAADITEAKDLGWVEQEQFRGDKSKWIDAATFLARGRDVMPLLRKNNERLRGELQQDRKKIAELEAKVKAGDESVQELMQFHKESVARKVAEARQQLLDELAAADDDPAEKAKAIGNLSKFDAEQAVAGTKLEKRGNGADTVEGGVAERRTPSEPEPWFKDWLEENPWAKETSRKTRMANVIAGELRADPKYADLKGAAFLDKVTELTEIELGGGDSRVEGSGGSAGGGGGGTGFSRLPREAQQAAREQSRKMVGEGRPFKTEKEWFNYYAANF